MLPDLVEYRLHIPHPTDDGQQRLLFGHDYAILAEGAIATVAMVPTSPELIAIPDRPVGVGLGVAVIGMRTGRLFYPFLRQDAFSIPHPLLKIHLTETGDVLCLDVQAGSADVDAARVNFPSGILDAQRIE